MRVISKKISLLALLFATALPAAADDGDQVVLTFVKGPGRAFMFEDHPVIAFDGDDVQVKRDGVETLVYSFDNLQALSFGHLKGDVNGDGEINLKDVKEMMDKGNAVPSTGDVNDDGKTDVGDIVTLLRQLAE